MSEPALTAPAAGLRAAGASNPGRVRANNEDRLYVDLEQGIFMVVDGVGGRAAGEVAASIAVDVVVDRLERPLGPPARRLREAIANANNEIHRLAQQSVEHRGMTCVVSVALVEDGRLTIGHVGDSRVYKITRRGIVKLTHDHSPVGEQEDSQEISEAEAMRHPRRHEVFRDVGSAPHGADDPEFIEIVHASFEPEAAILLCSDGLTDMISSAAIDRIIWARAGDPRSVVTALIDAANDAGGRDNVTALYVEGPGFSRTVALSAGPDRHPGRRGAVPARAGDGEPAAGPYGVAGDGSGPSGVRARAERRVMRTRITWLAIGVLVAAAASLGALPWLEALPTRRGRVLVAGAADGPHASIAAAMAAARPGDVVQVEPGEYVESVVLGDGVELVARIPGTAVLVAPTGQEGWSSLTVAGRGVIRGLRVVGRPDAPIATGVRLEGDGIELDDTSFEGNIGVAVDVRHEGEIVIRSNRFSQVRGLPLRIGPATQPLVRQNVFLQGPDGHGPAVHVQDGAVPRLVSNVFVGYPEPIGAPSARQPQLRRGNYVVAEPDRVGD